MRAVHAVRKPPGVRRSASILDAERLMDREVVGAPYPEHSNLPAERDSD